MASGAGGLYPRMRPDGTAKGLSAAVDDPTRDMILFAAGESIKVYNLSAFTFESLKAQDPGQLHENLIDYITKFSANVRDIFLDKFLFTEQLKRLNEGGILWQMFDRFTQIDPHPERVGNIEMGCPSTYSFARAPGSGSASALRHVSASTSTDTVVSETP